MRFARWLPMLVFVSVVVGHVAYSSRPTTTRKVCVFDAKDSCIEDKVVRTTENRISRKGFSGYVKAEDYFLTFAYALAFAFAAYALTQLSRNRKRAVAGAVAGLGLGSLLLAAGCFLIGCCGSPMLAVWLSLLGGKALGLTKPLIAGLTTLSVAGGYYCLRRGCKVDCCDPCAQTAIEQIDGE